jgi:hypothetical protein
LKSVLELYKSGKLILVHNNKQPHKNLFPTFQKVFHFFFSLILWSTTSVIYKALASCTSNIVTCNAYPTGDGPSSKSPLYATLGLASSVALSREAAVEDDKSEPSTYILASNNLIARGYYSQVANNNSDIGAFTHPLFLATFHFLDLSKKKNYQPTLRSSSISLPNPSQSCHTRIVTFLFPTPNATFPNNTCLCGSACGNRDTEREIEFTLR